MPPLTHPDRPRLKRRIRNALIVVVGLVIASSLVVALDHSLWHSAFFTGYVLLGCFVLLTLFGMRKRLSFVPGLGSARTWMQIHLYVGLATFFLFGLHVSWQVPNGWFERILTMLFLTVGLSGIYGLFITRVYPARLTSLGGEVLFERIPLLRSQLASQARNLVIEANVYSDVLGRFYINHLASFMERPRGLGYLLFPNGRQKRHLVTEIANLDRYLAAEQRQTSRALSDLVERRDRLDYHQALQGRLKLWLFVHIGFTYSLLLLAMLHAILAHAFSGSLL